MLEVAAAITTMGVLDWVAMGALAMAKGVLDDELHFLAGYRVAVLRDVKPRCVFELLAGRCKGPGQGQQQPDFESVVLRPGSAQTQSQCGERRSADEGTLLHGDVSGFLWVAWPYPLRGGVPLQCAIRSRLRPMQSLADLCILLMSAL